MTHTERMVGTGLEAILRQIDGHEKALEYLHRLAVKEAERAVSVPPVSIKSTPYAECTKREQIRINKRAAYLGLKDG